jgi:hypothetical protein
VRLLAVTINGEHYPMSYDTGHDGLCREETLDTKAYFYNVTFDYYKRNYSESGL